jgi:flagellar biosynthesis/type III secretory pathway protein FliH
MEFEEILLEEIITIIKEAKDENFMRADLKRLLKEHLNEYHEKIDEEWKGLLDSESYDAGYEDGFNSGYEQALEDVEDKMDDIRMRKGRGR